MEQNEIQELIDDNNSHKVCTCNFNFLKAIQKFNDTLQRLPEMMKSVNKVTIVSGLECFEHGTYDINIERRG